MELEEKTITGKKYICSNYISLAVWVRLVWDMAALSNTEYYSNITWIAMSLEKSTIMTTHNLKVSNFGTSKKFGTPKNFAPHKQFGTKNEVSQCTVGVQKIRIFVCTCKHEY